MNKKEITIQGKQYPVVFDFQTIINFEEIAGHSIFTDNLSTMKSRMAMIMAAVLSAEENSPFTVETLMGDGDWHAAKQVIEAFAVVDALAVEFYKIPEVEKKSDVAETPEDTGKEHPKN